MTFYFTYKPLIILFLIIGFNSYAQVSSSVSNNKKVRYLKKLERKNDRFTKKQEKKTQKLLTRLSKDEKALFEASDSVALDSTLMEDSFSKIAHRFDEELNADPSELLSKLSQPVSLQKSITFSEHLSGDLKDYLGQQLLTTTFITDSTCATCLKLKKQSEKTKQSIANASQKLEKLKKIQTDIKKHQDALKNYGVDIPKFGNKISGMDKRCYYYTQGMRGFKDMYTNPTKGIESALLKKLSFNKEFKLFQNGFNLPSSFSNITSGLTPDLTGYQTKAQVQAMMPQNAPGVTPDIKAQLIGNMQNALINFSELKDEKPNLSMLKDKPNFKINPYKGLPIIKRLIPGFTFQPQIKKINEPFIVDLGGTIGFRLCERLTPIVGASAKTGLGKDIYHIQFTYQGIVAKAGFDTKLAYGFSIQGWYEATWKPLRNQVTEEHAINYPQPSLIAGICNTYKISKKLNGTLMLGYDFFYNKHTPYTSPWVIRMGWQ